MSSGRVQHSDDLLRLEFAGTQRVLITPEDEDRFMMTVQEAAMACRFMKELDYFKREFEAFLGHLRQWCDNNSSVVSKCFVNMSGSGLSVILFTKGKEYNFEFDDVSSKLDIELAQMFPHCHADVFQTADSESTTPYQASLCIYGEP